MTNPRAIVFDRDNTLVTHWEIIHETLRLIFRDLARESWTFAQTKAWVGRSMRDSFATCSAPTRTVRTDSIYGHYRCRHLDRLTPLAGSSRGGACGTWEIYRFADHESFRVF